MTQKKIQLVKLKFISGAETVVELVTVETHYIC